MVGQFNQQKELRYFDKNTWFWIVVSSVLFIPFLGGVHLFDWDEINFAELAREMVVTGDYLRLQINYETFTEKPPLFFWLQAISMNMFGIGEYAARFPNAILGVIVVPFLYISGKFLIDRRFGFLWALSWFGSILPFLYFKSGIIDPLFNFFIFNGLFFLIHFIWRKNNYNNLYFSKSAQAYLWIAGISIGLGVLTKGPVAYLIVFLCLAANWVLERFKAYISWVSFFKFSFIALGVFLVWFAIDASINGPDFLVEFTIRQWELLTSEDAGHGGFIGYHFVVLLLGCFPASILAIRGMGRFREQPYHVQSFQRWMIILLWVVLILFSLVGTKIIHYSSMAYYPISFLSALALWNLLENRVKLKKWIPSTMGVVGFVIISISIALPYLGLHLDEFMWLFEQDPFAYANMAAEVNWTMMDYLPGLWYAIILVLFFLLLKNYKIHSYRVLFFGTSVWVFITLISFIAKIERISQNASVEFFESQQGEDAYLTTYYYKSYVPWFYGRVVPYTNEKALNQAWLLYGEVDKPVRISCKITAHEQLEKDITDANFIYKKNGFYFYQRNPVTSNISD